MSPIFSSLLLLFVFYRVAAATIATPASVGTRLAAILDAVLLIALSNNTATTNRT